MRWYALSAISCVACGRINIDAVQVTDANPDAPCTFGAFTVPMRLAGPIQSTNDDWSPAPTLDDTEVFFASYRPPSVQADLWYVTRPDATSAFGTPMRIPELSTAAYDGGPSLTADGLVIVWHSDVTGQGALSISQRASLGDAWDPPMAVYAPDATHFDMEAFVSPSGLELVFASSRPGAIGGLDLYEATRPNRSTLFSAPVALTELSSNVDDDCPTLSADGLEILFASRRPGGPGGLDVYTARRRAIGQPFSPPVLVPQLSTPFDETGLRLSRDGTTLYMNYDTLTGGGRDADFWVATRSCL